MKQNFVRLSTRAKTVSLRTLALVMGLVMLLSAVGVGSTLSAFALTNDGSGDQAASLSAVADLGTGIADTATQFKPTLPAYANASLRGDKVDLAATGLDGGDGIHLGIGTTATTWHGMGANEYEFTLDSAKTIYYTFSCSGSNFGKGSSTNAPTVDSQETYTWYTDKTSSTQFSIALPAGTYKFKLKGIQSNNANCMEYQFWKVSGGGGDDSDESDYYLFSSWTTWEANSVTDYPLTKVSDNLYKYEKDGWSGDQYFRFYRKSDSAWFGAKDGNNTVITVGADESNKKDVSGNGNSFKTTTNGDRVIWLDTSAWKSWVTVATTPTAASLAISADPDTLAAEGDTTTITVTASDLAYTSGQLKYTLYDSADTQIATKTVAANTTSTTFETTSNYRTKEYYAVVEPATSGTAYDPVQSGTVTISNTDEQYVPTYTVAFSSSNTTYGTVTAKSTYKGTTTTLTSGDSVKEGASVTFTATEKTGGTFVNWSTFDTTATTVTRVIRAATTVQGVFGQKGYQIIAGNNIGVAMKELSNGTYISANSYADGNWFQIVRNADNKSSVGNNSDDSSHCEYIKNSDKHAVTSWRARPDSWNYIGSFANKTGGARYVVYDPATDQVWLTSEPDDLYGVTVIAKDGTIRYGYSTAAKYTSAFGNTTLTVTDGDGTGIASHEAYDGLAEAVDLTAAQVREGITLKVVTQVDAAHLASGYYVKGFVVSGYEESFSVLMQDFDGNTDVTPEDIKDWIDRGYNEFELTLDTYPAKNIEITPVYAIKETTAGTNIRFYVDGFAGDVYKSWDGVIAVDAYNTSGDPILGEYPGQPMINYNGRYMVDLPRSGVTGITLNNYVWDRVHSNLFYGTEGTATPDTNNGYLQKIQKANKQTYDFNDFVYLKQVMDNDGQDEDIFFSFRHKYDENHDTVETSNLGQSTYYVDTTGGSTESTPFDYRNGFKTINPNDSIYQWENLTDIYNNRVDIFGDKIDIKNENGEAMNEKAAYDNPIRIVSNGYDYSKAGKFATAWAVYAPVDANGNAAYNGAYDRYELVDVFGGQGNVVNGVGTFDSSAYLINPTHQLNLRDKYDKAYSESSQQHSGSNFVYDMAMIPTVISYEYAVYRNKSNLNLENTDDGETKGDPGLRSDGRWFTTTSDQFLTAHTVVEYAEKDDDSLYHRDYFQSGGIDYTSGSEYDKTVNTGLSTGIKAYFENDDSDDGVDSGTGVAYQNTPGDTEAYAVSDGECTFNLKTVGDTNGDYVFKGWYLYSNGKYSFITREASYESEATANDVYVARYYKVPSGNLQITHTLHPDSTGKADCYAKVEVMNGNNPVFTYPETTETIKVTPTYMKDNSDNTLRITLKTVCTDKESFEKFYDNVSGTIQELAVRGVLNNVSAITKNGNEASVVITTNAIKTFFTDGEQTVKSLPFYSKLGVNLMITHKLDMNDSATAALNNADTFVRVEIYDTAGTTLQASYPSNDPDDYAGANDTIVIPPEYFINDVYTVKVYLKTDLAKNDFSAFNGFYVYGYQLKYPKPVELNSIIKEITTNDNTEDRYSTAVFTFSMQSLFDNDGTPLVTEIPYLSRLYKPQYTYNIKYNYPAYDKTNGYQSYTIKGTFSDDILNNQMRITDDGTLDFTDRSLQTNFINSNAPYEDNFQKLVKVSSTYQDTHRATSIDFDVTMNAEQQTLTVLFSLPYEQKSNADSYAPLVGSDNRIVKLNTNRTVNRSNVYGRSWITYNNTRFPSDIKEDDSSTQPQFIKAPLMIYDGQTPLYFQYWSVETTPKYNASAREYTRCYDPEFNLAIFQDCKLTPIYRSDVSFETRNMPNPPTAWDDYSRFDPDQTRKYYNTNPASEVTITFLENSRNQYNNGDYGKLVNLDANGNFASWQNTLATGIPNSRKGAADRIYSDFLLTFDNIKDENGVTRILKEDYASNQMQCGLVIEGVGQLEKDGDQYVVKTDTEYAGNSTYAGLTVEQVKNYLTTGTSVGKNLGRSKIDVTQLDNKNRIQYYYGINAFQPKSASATAPEGEILNVDTVSTNKTMVYKAYAYIGNGTANADTLTDVVVSPTPVYFTIYNDANVKPGQSLSY